MSDRRGDAFGPRAHEQSPQEAVSALRVSPAIAAGQMWTPTRAGSRAMSRTVVWVGCKNPALLWVDWPNVGYVRDPANPAFPRTGHDSWIGFAAFVAWIRKHQAVCIEISDV